MSKKLINLDCMDIDDLVLYIEEYQTDSRYAKEVAYAVLARDAQDLRLRGEVSWAMRKEAEADRVYKTLPAQERW